MLNQWDSPENCTILWRILGLFLLSILWLLGQGGEVGIILLLLLSIMALARWRFSLSGWSILFDQLVCLIAIPLWTHAPYALAIPLFEGMLVAKPLLLLPILIAAVAIPFFSLPLIAAFIYAGFSGWAIGRWARETQLYIQEADQQRRDKYQLERLKSELLLANFQVAKVAELSERDRIARELHDSVGHEITAAVLAFQAFEQLWREGDPLAEDMFQQGRERLSNSAHKLRETVHNMKPTAVIGIDSLKDIINGFTLCPVDFKVFGDTSRVPVYLWTILEPCLKEALTNVIRHAEATRVDITIDVNPHIVRLSIYNNGTDGNIEGNGIGIRNLRQRARAVGGSLSIDISDGFRLICVLPIAG